MFIRLDLKSTTSLDDAKRIARQILGSNAVMTEGGINGISLQDAPEGEDPNLLSPDTRRFFEDTARS